MSLDVPPADQVSPYPPTDPDCNGPSKHRKRAAGKSEVPGAVKALWEEFVGAGLPEADRLRETDIPSLSERRAVIADTLGVKTGSLQSTLAYIRYSATEAIAECGLVGRIERDLLVFVARHCRSAESKEDREILIASLGEYVNSKLSASNRISCIQLDSVVSYYEHRLAKRPGGAPSADDNREVDWYHERLARGESALTVIRELLTTHRRASAIQDTQDVDSISVKTFGGTSRAVRVKLPRPRSTYPSSRRGNPSSPEELYANPTKDAGRAVCADFCRRRSTAEDRESGSLVLMPTQEPQGELRHYTPWFPRSKIIGIEGRAPQKQFEAACAAEGIRPEYGELIDALGRLQDPIRFGVFDLLGPACMAYQRALTKVKLAPLSCVIVNVRGNREDAAIQEILRSSDRAHHSNLHVQDALDAIRDSYSTRSGRGASLTEKKLSEIWGKGSKHLSETIANPPHRELHELRNNEIPQLLLLMLGAGRDDRADPYYNQIRNGRLRWLDESGLNYGRTVMNALLSVETTLWQTLASHPLNPKDLGHEGSIFALPHSRLMGLAVDVLENRTKIRHLEKYWYKSSASTHSPRYYTLCAEVHDPKSYYDQHRDLARTLLDFASRIIIPDSAAPTQTRVVICGADNRPLAKGDPILKDTRAIFLNGKTITGQLNVIGVLRSVVRHIDWLRDYEHDRPKVQREIRWQEIKA